MIWLLDLVSLGLRGLLVAFMVRRGQWKAFLFFFIYLCFSMVTTTVRLSVRNHDVAYFYVFYVTEAVYAILSGLVIVEAFRRVFVDFYENRKFQILLLLAFALIGVLVLVAPIRHHLDASSVYAFILSANLSIRILQVAALALFLGLAVFLNLQGRRYEMGIVLGYGLFATVYLFALALRSQLGAKYTWTVTVGHPIAYDCAVVIWFWAFWKNEPKPTFEQYLGETGPESVPDHLERITAVYRRLGRKRWTR
jgi:hypothetical protein